MEPLASSRSMRRHRPSSTPCSVSPWRNVRRIVRHRQRTFVRNSRKSRISTRHRHNNLRWSSAFRRHISRLKAELQRRIRRYMTLNLDAALEQLSRDPAAPLDLAELALLLARDEFPFLDV